jgi:hypothetical protein
MKDVAEPETQENIKVHPKELTREDAPRSEHASAADLALSSSAQPRHQFNS